MATTQHAPRNRTITLSHSDRERLRAGLIKGHSVTARSKDVTVLGDCMVVARSLRKESADLLLLDPPYNLNKRFGARTYSRRSVEDYAHWLETVLDAFIPLLKPTATVYICGDWNSSASIQLAAEPRLKIRNRITWEREKGRGAKTNWKNASEDIWFCTLGNSYTFNVNDVKLRRKVIAPYRKENGEPKDWSETPHGNFRDTHPSNFWTDITVPFWSMPENTDHPAQKSEKLIAKLLLASSNAGDLVLDPFLGSGTTSVVAKKLGRRYIGIEIEEEFALLAERRLELTDSDSVIQGYASGVFWDRNATSVARAQTEKLGSTTDESTVQSTLL